MSSRTTRFSVLSDVEPRLELRPSESFADGLQVFILGSARSGTSLIWAALKKVFDLPGAGEGHVVPIYQRLIHQFHAYALEFGGDKGVLASRLDVRAFHASMCADLREFYLTVYPGRAWINKTPGAEAITGVPMILESFPAAKIIVMRRPPIETVQSFQRKFDATFIDGCHDWAACAHSLVEMRELGLPMLEIDQFEMANDPQSVGVAVTRHLGRPEAHEELAEVFRSERLEQTSSHDWRQRLTLEASGWSLSQVEQFREICGPWIEPMGY